MFGGLSMIVGSWGEDKSCKTTFALTFPKPLVFMEFDIGGFGRAVYRFEKDSIIVKSDKEWKQQTSSNLIKYEAYPLPMTFGRFDPKKLEIIPSKMVVGMKELFYKWAGKYITHLQDDRVATIVIDTATLLKQVCDDGYLQEIQENQLNPDGTLKDPKDKFRVQLIQIEHREPNTRMRGILYNAKAAGKHLILVHHARDEYKPMPQKDGTLANSATGKRERAGFATLGDSADIILYNYWDSKAMKPYAKVELAEVKPLEGMVIEEPSFEKLDKAIKMLKGIS
jgi:hypothetical protein